MNYRNSKQRNAILQVLSVKDYHPTVDEIYYQVKNDFSKISLATVYRNVEQLCQMGKIWKLDISDGPARYDGNMEKHFHILCDRCGEYRDVWLDQKLEEVMDLDDVFKKYEMTGYNIDFFGVCDKCNGNSTVS